MQNVEQLIGQMILLQEEMPWLEFKHNNDDPQMIGENISALANAAAFHDREKAYLIWGVEDGTHCVIGTSFDPEHCKVKGQELESWLRNGLSENASFYFQKGFYHGMPVVVLIIDRAFERTVMFNRVDYIKVGSYTKKLNEHPTLKTRLWDRLRSTRFEDQPAKEGLSLHDALGLLDYESYFILQNKTLPGAESAIAYYLLQDGLLLKQDDGQYAITNMGAVLLAKHLNQFPSVSRKAVRIVQYEYENRLQMLRQIVLPKGYACGFEEMMRYLDVLLPAREVIDGALRRTERRYPVLALREAVANALIHQDFSITGTGPMIEIFPSRLEITNPGVPLVNVMRIIDNPARSRNEKLAALMRQFHICEESGTGWDKIAISCEMQRLPAPKISVYEESMRVCLYGYVPFSDIAPEDKIWACYLHACICYVEGKQMSNATLRERFGLETSASSAVSKIIKEALAKGMIKAFDPDTAPRYMKYVPVWA